MKKGTILYGAVCFILGAAICGGSAAFAAGVTAERSRNVFYVDGEPVELEAYFIDGTNYVRLRDVGEAVGFNVYWDGTVQIESDRPYTGVAPEPEENMDIRLEIVRLANEERKKVGAPPLVVNAALMDAAQDCAGQGFTSHNTEYECRSALKYGYVDVYLKWYEDNKSITRSFATGKTLGDSGYDLDKMFLVGSAITKAFHGEGWGNEKAGTVLCLEAEEKKALAETLSTLTPRPELKNVMEKLGLPAEQTQTSNGMEMSL